MGPTALSDPAGHRAGGGRARGRVETTDTFGHAASGAEAAAGATAFACDIRVVRLLLSWQDSGNEGPACDLGGSTRTRRSARSSLAATCGRPNATRTAIEIACKPWRHADNSERLDGENGLLLTPAVDHLFDRGFISFEDNGEILISPVADTRSLARMGIPPNERVRVGAFSTGQRHYLEYHRSEILLSTDRR